VLNCLVDAPAVLKPYALEDRDASADQGDPCECDVYGAAFHRKLLTIKNRNSNRQRQAPAASAMKRRE
jgi:hypothetical protein